MNKTQYARTCELSADESVLFVLMTSKKDSKIHTVSAIDTRSLATVQRLVLRARRVQLGECGALAVAFLENQPAEIWDARSGVCVACAKTIQDGPAFCDERRGLVLSACNQRAGDPYVDDQHWYTMLCTLWDNGFWHLRLRGHTHTVTGCTLWAGYIVTVSLDGSARVWDAVSGVCQLVHARGSGMKLMQCAAGENHIAVSAMHATWVWAAGSVHGRPHEVPGRVSYESAHGRIRGEWMVTQGLECNTLSHIYLTNLHTLSTQCIMRGNDPWRLRALPGAAAVVAFSSCIHVFYSQSGYVARLSVGKGQIATSAVSADGARIILVLATGMREVWNHTPRHMAMQLLAAHAHRRKRGLPQELYRDLVYQRLPSGVYLSAINSAVI